MRKEEFITHAQHGIQITSTELSKGTGDVISFSVLGMTLMNAIPDVAAIVSLLWMVIRLFETDTVRKLLKRKKKKEDK
jgi:hypothetical protein